MKVLKQAYNGENSSRIMVITLKGEFDSFVTNPFSAEIEKVHAEGISKIALNMAMVTFVNSTALGAMIRARKSCRAAGGDLVISEASSTVQEAMEALGLDKLFTSHEDDEAAVRALDSSAALELSDESESTVMLRSPGHKGTVVGKLRRLEADALECRVAGDLPDSFVHGHELSLKFRLPLYRKDYFEVKARIDGVREEAAGRMISLHLTDISDDDRDAIQRFLDDMNDLRDAARGGD